MRTINELRESENGFTLPELIMYALLLAIVLSVAAGIMVSGTIAERTVRTVYGANTSGQLAADNIETGIRNSSAFTLTVPTASTQFLRARVATGTASIVWRCAAWYYSPTVDNGSIWYKIDDASISAPTSAGLSSWTRLANNVKPRTGTTIFSVVGTQLQFSFEAQAGTDPPASINSSASSRAEVQVTAPCF